MSDKQIEKQKRKAPSTAFKPGQSGNPKGRPPKGLTEAERTRNFLDEFDPERNTTRGEAVRLEKYKLALAGDIRAIDSLETRAYGKPIETVKIDAATGDMPTSLLEAAMSYRILPTTTSTTESIQ